MEVGQTLGMGAGAGSMAELHFGEFAGGLDQVILMAEAVGEHDVAAAVGQVGSGVVAVFVFFNAGNDEEIFAFHHAQRGAGFAGRVDEVEVIGGVFIMQGDEADLHVGLGLRESSGDAQAQGEGQQQSDELFHVLLLLRLSRLVN